VTQGGKGEKKMTKLQQIGGFVLKLVHSEKCLSNLKSAPRSFNCGIDNMYMNNAIEKARVARFNLNLLLVT